MEETTQPSVIDKPVFEEYKVSLRKLAEELKPLSGLDWSICYEYGLNVIIDRFAEKLGFSKKTIESHLTQLNAPPPIDLKTTYTVKELVTTHTYSSSWIVPKLYKKGALYIVGAAPKSFKSMTMYDLAYAVTVSGDFLGMPCSKGKVIFFQCEEGTPTVADRLIGRGFDDEENPDVAEALAQNKLIVERKFNIKSDLDRLQELIFEHKPTLVIFDSLRKISSQLEVSENSVEFSKHVYNLQNLLILNDVTGILIHHKNKAQGAKGLHGLSGSLSIAGACDGIILMNPEPPENGDLMVRLDTVPRDGAPLSIKIRYVRSEGGQWKFVLEEELNVDPEVARLEKRIVRELAHVAPVGLDRLEVANKLGISNSSNKLTLALDRLVEALVIHRQKSKTTRRYTYSIPTDNPWSREDNITATFISAEARVADQLAACQTKQELKDLTDEWEVDYKNAIYNLLNPPEKQRLIELIQTPLFDVGTLVEYEEKSYSVVSCHWEPDAKSVLYVLDGMSKFIEEKYLKKVDNHDF